MSLLTLFGLTPLGAGVEDGTTMEASVTKNPDGLWEATVSNGLGAEKWTIEPRSFEPRRLVIVDNKGQDVALVDYDPVAFEPVTTPGVSALSVPRIPGRVRLTLPGKPALEQAFSEPTTMMLRIVNPDADVQDEPMDRVFDLDRLIKALQPVEVFRTQGARLFGGGLLDPAEMSSDQLEHLPPETGAPSP